MVLEHSLDSQSDQNPQGPLCACASLCVCVSCVCRADDKICRCMTAGQFPAKRLAMSATVPSEEATAKWPRIRMFRAAPVTTLSLPRLSARTQPRSRRHPGQPVDRQCPRGGGCLRRRRRHLDALRKPHAYDVLCSVAALRRGVHRARAVSRPASTPVEHPRECPSGDCTHKDLRDRLRLESAPRYPPVGGQIMTFTCRSNPSGQSRCRPVVPAARADCHADAATTQP